MKRRTLLTYMPFGALAQVTIAQAATKIIAKSGAIETSSPEAMAPDLFASQWLMALLKQHFLPSATALVAASQALVSSVASAATANAAPGASRRTWALHRPLWITTMLAWERLAAVSVGPLVERRSARAIDFWPTRPAQIQRLLDDGLLGITTMAQLDTVGATARGLPALEWLLWKTDGREPANTYAYLLAQQVAAESQALLAGYQALVSTPWTEVQARALYGEWFGQAVGGLDQLRIKKMASNSRAKDSSLWVRGLSSQTAAAWWAQAQGLQAFLVGSPTSQAAARAFHADLPVAGTVNGLLLGRGHAPESEALLDSTQAMLRLVQAARPGNAVSVHQAQAALAQLSAQLGKLAETVLNITLGFTDADGD